MATTVPEYIEARIRRRAPSGAPVVPNSTPVIAFGDARRATTATLGWNPSRVEFLSSDGTELIGEGRRLETLTSVGEADLASAEEPVIRRIFDGCNKYFQRRPYGWFKKLKRVLQFVQASFYEGSACHLDLVQWATDPTWGRLARTTRESLLDADLPFLKQQLRQEHFRLLLLNGMGIVKACRMYLGYQLDEVAVDGAGRVRMFAGQASGGLAILGWNINLQSSFGVTNEEIDLIGKSAHALCRQATTA